MGPPKTNLTQANAVATLMGGLGFWVSDPEQIDDGGNDWGFAIYANKDVFLATFTYPSKEAASRARDFMIPALRDVVFVATAER